VLCGGSAHLALVAIKMWNTLPQNLPREEAMGAVDSVGRYFTI
jgi:hypothetical protein